jgi:hypothetical protein
MKAFYIQYGIGRSKYVVTYTTDNKHKDGSPMDFVGIFSNKVKLNTFINELKNQGYEQSI